MSKRLYKKKNILDLKRHFTLEDLQLAQWLQTAPDELIHALLALLGKQFTNSVITDCFFDDHQLLEDKPFMNDTVRKYLPVLFVYELKRYSAHSFHFLAKKPGYDLILTKVLNRLLKQRNQKIDCVDKTVSEKEKLIAEIILSETQTKQSSSKQKIIEQSTSFFLKTLVKKLTPQALKKMTPALGWALLAKDVYDLGGEASRVTIPFVIGIAVYKNKVQSLLQALKLKTSNKQI